MGKNLKNYHEVVVLSSVHSNLWFKGGAEVDGGLWSYGGLSHHVLSLGNNSILISMTMIYWTHTASRLGAQIMLVDNMCLGRNWLARLGIRLCPRGSRLLFRVPINDMV